jgi:hypothetical protein
MRSIARARPLLAVFVVFGSLGACSPYDPSLPDEPFLCGDEEPRCPDGYTCVTGPADEMVCRKNGVPPDASLGGDASAIQREPPPPTSTGRR